MYLPDQRPFIAEVQKAQAAVAKAEADLQYAKEGVEVFRAESRPEQSRATLIKAEQDMARYTPLVKAQAASQTEADRNRPCRSLLAAVPRSAPAAISYDTNVCTTATTPADMCGERCADNQQL